MAIDVLGLLSAWRGQRKVLFGTNCPMVTRTHALTGLDELGFTDEACGDFLHNNAERVFRLDRKVYV